MSRVDRLFASVMMVGAAFLLGIFVAIKSPPLHPEKLTSTDAWIAIGAIVFGLVVNAWRTPHGS